ncbi:uncharacterized protein LDX57_009916 [Aspergillus melleus]|uniref:uncharacterized protein n=1 Tax=Aspergillus melleus TaxID=138277 RepID=UPI001E8D88EE|nr:uncharacterized protein LDX57_009916 [Aspergillus melleus]KAH8432277.1 hypothetical protein LDX57_009916 [Aspergillus melleus]
MFNSAVQSILRYRIPRETDWLYFFLKFGNGPICSIFACSTAAAAIVMSSPFFNLQAPRFSPARGYKSNKITTRADGWMDLGGWLFGPVLTRQTSYHHIWKEVERMGRFEEEGADESFD